MNRMPAGVAILCERAFRAAEQIRQSQRHHANHDRYGEQQYSDDRGGGIRMVRGKP